MPTGLFASRRSMLMAKVGVLALAMALAPLALGPGGKALAASKATVTTTGAADTPGTDDSADHDANDDHSQDAGSPGTDDGSDHDANDDNGGDEHSGNDSGDVSAMPVGIGAAVGQIAEHAPEQVRLGGIHTSIIHVHQHIGAGQPKVVLRVGRIRAHAEHCPAQIVCRSSTMDKFDFLNARGGQLASTLCGRNAVQIAPGNRTSIDLEALAERLRGIAEVNYNRFLVRFRAEGFELTVFLDGRCIVKGTEDSSVARSIYARYIGG